MSENKTEQTDKRRSRKRKSKKKAKRRQRIILATLFLGVPLVLGAIYYVSRINAPGGGTLVQGEEISKTFEQVLDTGDEQELLAELQSIKYGPDLYLPLRLEAANKRIAIAERLTELRASPDSMYIAQRAKFFSLVSKVGMTLKIDILKNELAELTFFTDELASSPDPKLNSLQGSSKFVNQVSRYLLAAPDSDLRQEHYASALNQLDELRGRDEQSEEVEEIFGFVKLFHEKSPSDEAITITKKFIDCFKGSPETKVVALTEQAQQLIDRNSLVSSDSGTNENMLTQINTAIENSEPVNEARAKNWLVQTERLFVSNDFEAASAAVDSLNRIPDLKSFSSEFQQDLIRLEKRGSMIGQEIDFTGITDSNGAASDFLNDEGKRRIILFASQDKFGACHNKLVEIRSTFGASLLGPQLQLVIILVHREDEQNAKEQLVEFDRSSKYLDVFFLGTDSPRFQQLQGSMMIDEMPVWLALDGSTIKAINPTTRTMESLFVNR